MDRRSRALALACLATVTWWGSACGVGSSGSPETELPLPPPIDATLVSATADGAGATAGLEVTVATARQVYAGTLATARVTIRNTGPSTYFWQAGGCAIPATLVLTERDAAFDAAAGVSGAPRVSGEQAWDGSDDGLAPALAGARLDAGPQLAVPEASAGAGTVSCPADSFMKPVEPGDVLDDTGVFEVRMPPGDGLPGDGLYDVVAAFTAFASPEGYPQVPLPSIVARVGLEVVDEPLRTLASAEDLAGAVVTDGRVAAWFATVQIPGRPDLDQRARVGATWWRGAWEVWVRPQWGSSESARARIDPVTFDVVDARVVPDGLAPHDEPGAAQLDGAPPDLVLAPIDGQQNATAAHATAEPSEASVGDTVTITAGNVCGGLVIVYEVTADGPVERGALVGSPARDGTWVTAPQGSPMTLPPCQPAATPSGVEFTVPPLRPGDYSVCLTRDSGACADLTVLP